MIYREERGDLFELEPTHHLVHCVSADFALGAGIALEFNKRYDMRRKLQEWKQKWDAAPKDEKMIRTIFGYGDNPSLIKIDRVFNLVTKEKYWQKPTYESLQASLDRLRFYLYNDHVIQCLPKLAMPKIGCGLDGLTWDKVSVMIQETFEPLDVEIVVRYL